MVNQFFDYLDWCRYEKRIRDLSPPDKVFDYFASITGDDGTRYSLTFT